MATVFVVQSYQQRGRKLVADQPQSVKTSKAATDMAERLAQTRSGVVAYSQEIDVETDSYDDPRILMKAGVLPPDLQD